MTTPEPSNPADAPEVLTECPDACGATGDDVYRAEGHPTSCNWMMYRAERCIEHDELLRPDEPDCPAPDADSEAEDAHGRLGA